jgi:hypothetical protein
MPCSCHTVMSPSKVQVLGLWRAPVSVRAGRDEDLAGVQAGGEVVPRLQLHAVLGLRRQQLALESLDLLARRVVGRTAGSSIAFSRSRALAAGFTYQPSLHSTWWSASATSPFMTFCVQFGGGQVQVLALGLVAARVRAVGLHDQRLGRALCAASSARRAAISASRGWGLASSAGRGVGARVALGSAGAPGTETSRIGFAHAGGSCGWKSGKWGDGRGGGRADSSPPQPAQRMHTACSVAPAALGLSPAVRAGAGRSGLAAEYTKRSTGAKVRALPVRRHHTRAAFRRRCAVARSRRASRAACRVARPAYSASFYCETGTRSCSLLASPSR